MDNICRFVDEVSSRAPAPARTSEGYWHVRYMEALSKVDRAESAEARAAFLDLASHYESMVWFCDRTRLSSLSRIAA
jgi:hypothetical protein